MKNKHVMVNDFKNTFSKTPERAIYNLSSTLKTTMNTGDIVPLDVHEVIPGDSINWSIQSLLRQSTMIKPVLDNAYVDVMSFFVPSRLIWDDFQKFFGENDDEWAQVADIVIPKIQAPEGGWGVETIADYLGVPPNKPAVLNALPFRAYAKIFNDWFRDQNLMKSSHIDMSSNTLTGSNGDNYITDLALGGKPAKASKYHDYFTSGLVSPQKGEAVTIGLAGAAPVQSRNDLPGVKYINTPRWATANGEAILDPGGGLDNQPQFNVNGKENHTGVIQVGVNREFGGDNKRIQYGTSAADLKERKDIYFENLYADLSEATGITINDLRNAITIQQMLELDARSGTRYTEYLHGHFGVNNGDLRMQRSEYLGGFHKPLGIQQVPQLSSTSDTPQGNLAAFGETRVREGDTQAIKKTFSEHGYILTVATVRYYHTYQQGLDRLFTVNSKYDLYDPIFANIGEQPIYNSEIFLTGDNKIDNEVFAFNEAWARYRYKPNRTSGKMRSADKDSLDVYHYGDFYKETPKLSAEWMWEDPTNIDRTLAIKSTEQPQFQVDFYFQRMDERPLPARAIPGLKRI